jgi:hypothetical protein
LTQVENRWLTKEEREAAKNNGISYWTLYKRVNEHHWKIERAITEIPKKTSLIDGYREKCKENGISDSLFHHRVKSGMSKEDASTKPPVKMNRNGEKVCKVEGCKNRYRAKGFCNSHYMRWWRYGEFQ